MSGGRQKSRIKYDRRKLEVNYDASYLPFFLTTELGKSLFKKNDIEMMHGSFAHAIELSKT